MKDKAVPITFTLKERDLLLKSELFLDEAVISKIRLAQISGQNIRLSMSVEDLSFFLDSLAGEINHTESMKTIKELRSIYDRLNLIYEEHTGIFALQNPFNTEVDDFLDDLDDEDFPDELEEPFKDPLVEMLDPSLRKEIDELLALASKKLFNTPNRTLDGLSLAQGHFLCDRGWWGDSAPIKFNLKLSKTDFAGARLLHNTYTLAEMIDERGGAPLTAAGNLKREFVAAAFERFLWPAGYQELFRKTYKRINEEQLSELHHLKASFVAKRLMMADGAKLTLTKNGRELLAENGAGRLASLLLDSKILEWKQLFSGSHGEFHTMIQLVPLFFFRLGRLPAGKRLLNSELTARLLPFDPKAIDDPINNIIYAKNFLSIYLFPMLLSLGLLGIDGEEPFYLKPEQDHLLYKTELFDRFLIFEALPAEFEYDA